ncbi:MAG: DUF805 domain-containing protein, partial [Porticoccaceae bacterium]
IKPRSAGDLHVGQQKALARCSINFRGKGVIVMKWYLDVLKKYAVFTGRARRKEYWMFFLFNIIVAFVIGFVGGILQELLHVNMAFISVSYTLAIVIPSISVAVRRMHDTGHSGWWVIVPIANIIFLFVNGEPQENRFGPDPKAIAG